MSENPQDKEPKPPFDEQEKVAPPGYEAQMTPTADHGEESYKGSGKLTGKAAIITGGDSGIGRAIAIAYAREGADVLISYLNEDVDANETRRLVEAEGRKCITVAGDIGEEALCKRIVETATKEFGRLDILVNNAAFQRTHESIAEFSSQEIEKTFRTNVYAMFYLCKAALPVMETGGAIINTTSIQSYKPDAMLLAYAATKGAITNFTKAFSQEAIDKGIRVNAVAPGPIWTPLIPSTMPEEKVKTFGQDTPMKRAGQPAELAPAYVFLASQDSSYIVGEVIGVTGGDPIS